MDNLSSHKRKAVRAAIEAAGTRLLFHPPYSPGFNPIQMAFSKFKALLRKAAERTVEGLWSAIGRLIGTVTRDECANFFAAAGYEPDQSENALDASPIEARPRSVGQRTGASRASTGRMPRRYQRRTRELIKNCRAHTSCGHLDTVIVLRLETIE